MDMKKLAWSVVSLALVLAIPSLASAQFSTVMLPSQSQFSINTSVMVPDSGGVLLGSVNRASSGYVSRGFGPFTNRAFGRSLGSSTASAHVYVIDLGEMDRRMQEEAAAMREASYYQYVMAYPKVAQASRLTASARNERAEIPEVKRVVSGLSLAAQKQLAAQEDAEALAVIQAEATRALDRAAAAEKKGQMSSAKSYYLAAVRKGDELTRKSAIEGYRRVLAATSQEIAQP
jgi:hypothetical protein